MTKAASLACGESADWVCSKGKRCCLSDFKTPESAWQTCVTLFILDIQREVMWIVLVSRAWQLEGFERFFCPANKKKQQTNKKKWIWHVGQNWRKSSRYNTSLQFQYSASSSVCGLKAMYSQRFHFSSQPPASVRFFYLFFCLNCKKKNAIAAITFEKRLGGVLYVLVFLFLIVNHASDSCVTHACPASSHCISRAIKSYLKYSQTLVDRLNKRTKHKHQWEVFKKKLSDLMCWCLTSQSLNVFSQSSKSI